MYKSNNSNIPKNNIYHAIRHYLYLFHKSKSQSQTKENISQTQLVFVVPSEYESDESFIKNVLEPLLGEAQWVSNVDPKSKLFFVGQIQAALYSRQFREKSAKAQQTSRTERERKYLSCLIQRSLDGSSLTLRLAIIQMKYDKNFIAAFGSSIFSSEHHLYAPKFQHQSSEFRIPAILSKNTHALPNFLYERIFAKSPSRLLFEREGSLRFSLDDEYKEESFLKELMIDLISQVYMLILNHY